MRQLYFTRDLILLPVFVIFYTFIVIKQLQHWQYKLFDSSVFLLFEVWSLKYGYGYILMIHVSSKYLENCNFGNLHNECFIWSLIFFFHIWLIQSGTTFYRFKHFFGDCRIALRLTFKNISVPKATFLLSAEFINVFINDIYLYMCKLHKHEMIFWSFHQNRKCGICYFNHWILGYNSGKYISTN